MCCDNEILVLNSISLNRKDSQIDLSTQCTNTIDLNAKVSKDLQVSDEHDEKIINISNNFCPNKMCSESTQTDDSLIPISLESLSQQNSYSVINCKKNPLLTENNILQQLNAFEPITNLSTNGISVSSSTDANKNHKITDESTVLDMLDVESCNKITCIPNFSFNETKNVLNTHKSLFIDETINMNKSNVKTYEDIKHIMKRLNCDLNLLTKNSSKDTNDIVNCEHLKFENSFNHDYDLDLFTKNSYSDTNDLYYNQEFLKLGENNLINCQSSSVSNN